MPRIELLDNDTINRIAAGEVIERPASVIKELLENAIDAGATQVTAEIRDGGISLIRVTDNGCGIPKEEIATAFLRHATSKIRTDADISQISTLGFRGEALPSIASVSRTEIITKPRDQLAAARFVAEANRTTGPETVGAPDGTTILVNDLFQNVPVRRKFLHTPATEAAHAADVAEKAALSHPEVAIRFISGGQNKFSTAGTGSIKDIIYTLYGREVLSHIVEYSRDYDAMRLRIFAGKPQLVRSSRACEISFINGRHVNSPVLRKAMEEAYRPYLMQHRYPFVILYMEIEPELVDVNVHPSKLEVRFSDPQRVLSQVRDAIAQALQPGNLIPDVTLRDREKTAEQKIPREKQDIYPHRVYTESAAAASVKESMPQYISDLPASLEKKTAEKTAGVMTALNAHKMPETSKVCGISEAPETLRSPETLKSPETLRAPEPGFPDMPAQTPKEKPHQQELFEDRFLSRESLAQHRIIGQLFSTYWLVEFKGSLYIIDQHAAHEKVLYEKLMAQIKTAPMTSQSLFPSIVLTLSPLQEDILKKHLQALKRLGFGIEPFGGREWTVHAVPANLPSIGKKDLLLSMIDGLGEDESRADLFLVQEKAAMMACKAAIKGNMNIDISQAKQLINDLLALENPYNCPHGRPTIISITKGELEKKFGRIQ